MAPSAYVVCSSLGMGSCSLARPTMHRRSRVRVCVARRAGFVCVPPPQPPPGPPSGPPPQLEDSDTPSQAATMHRLTAENTAYQRRAPLWLHAAVALRGSMVALLPWTPIRNAFPYGRIALTMYPEKSSSTRARIRLKRLTPRSEQFRQCSSPLEGDYWASWVVHTSMPA
eukprot:5267168-Pleurochrysis_carterae.AAC.6